MYSHTNVASIDVQQECMYIYMPPVYIHRQPHFSRALMHWSKHQTHPSCTISITNAARSSARGGARTLIDSLCNFKRIPISQLGVYPKYRILNKRRSCISAGAKKASKFISAWALILRGDTVGTFAEEQWAQWSYLDIS